MRWFVTKIIFHIIIFLTKALKWIAPPEFVSWANAGFPYSKNKRNSR